MEKVNLGKKQFTKDDIYNLLLYVSEENPNLYISVFRKSIYELEVDWAVTDEVVSERVFKYCQEYEGFPEVDDEAVDMLLKTEIPEGYFGE